jgi:hypothetical protein
MNVQFAADGDSASTGDARAGDGAEGALHARVRPATARSRPDIASEILASSHGLGQYLHPVDPRTRLRSAMYGLAATGWPEPHCQRSFDIWSIGPAQL